MNEEIAKIAAQFLMRVQLSGSEVPAFNMIMLALEQVKDVQAKDNEDQAGKAPIP